MKHNLNKGKNGCIVPLKTHISAHFLPLWLVREGSVTPCQEAVRYWSQECMTMMGFDSPLRGPELSQTGACSFFLLQGPRVTLAKVCIPIRMDTLKHGLRGCKKTKAEAENKAPVFNIQIRALAKCLLIVFMGVYIQFQKFVMKCCLHLLPNLSSFMILCFVIFLHSFLMQ